MQPDLWSLYARMLRSRLFEEAVTQLWADGLISGEMHLGTGEEAIIAGITAHLMDGDAIALDHRGTSSLLMRGVDPVLILQELLGLPGGLCHGQGGHMHLFSKEHLAASSGIVGAVGPTAVGFALAAQYLRPGTVSVAFFGEGAINQGMLLESMNLASIWNLPVLFVCKDDRWSITTASGGVTGGSPLERARSLGLSTFHADGREVIQIWQEAHKAINQVRDGLGPAFFHTTCVHLEGHFLGYQILRITRDPFKEVPQVALPLMRSFFRRRGSPLLERLDGLKTILSAILANLRDPRQDANNDPIFLTRIILSDDDLRLNALEEAIEAEIGEIVRIVLKGVTL